MTPRDYLEVVRSRWRIVVAGLCLGLLAAAALTALTPRQYAADVTIYVGARAPEGDLSAAVDGGELAVQRMSTYLEVLTSDRIATEVASSLVPPVPPSEIADKVTATTAPDTVLLTATVVDASPQRAVQIANLVAERFVANVAELEAPPGSTAPALVAAQVFQPAQASPTPVVPRPLFNLLLGGIAGLLAGLGLALLRHRADTSVRSREQLPEITGVPVLGAIEADPGFARHPLVVQHDRSGRAAEAFRQLRANLQFLDVDRKRSVWLVTSAAPGGGKTTTVANLAAAMADAGTRVLVIEADLRRPRIAEIFRVDRTVGLTNVLARGMSGSQVVRPVRAGLDVLPSGMLPPNPGELLGSAAMAGLIEQVRDRYDVVLLDTSPLSPVADAVALAPRADGVLLVVPHGGVRREQLSAALDTLRAVSAPLLGTVMTGIPAIRRRHAGDDAYLAGDARLGVPAPEGTDQAVSTPSSAWTRTRDIPARTTAGPRTDGFPAASAARPVPSPRPRTPQPVPDGEPTGGGDGGGDGGGSSDQASPPR